MLITPHHYENFSTKRIFCKQPRIITFLAGHNEYDSDYCNKAIESYPATAPAEYRPEDKFKPKLEKFNYPH